MKTASIRQLRSDVAGLMRETEPVVITNHGKPSSVLINLAAAPELSVAMSRQIARALMQPLWDKLANVPDKEIMDGFAKSRKRSSR